MSAEIHVLDNSEKYLVRVVMVVRVVKGDGKENENTPRAGGM